MNARIIPDARQRLRDLRLASELRRLVWCEVGFEPAEPWARWAERMAKNLQARGVTRLP